MPALTAQLVACKKSLTGAGRPLPHHASSHSLTHGGEIPTVYGMHERKLNLAQPNPTRTQPNQNCGAFNWALVCARPKIQSKMKSRKGWREERVQALCHGRAKGEERAGSGKVGYPVFNPFSAAVPYRDKTLGVRIGYYLWELELG